MFHRLALLLACTAPAFAQPLPDLVTDRPDFTESGVVVPHGHVQIEAGATTTFAGEAEVFSGPELLVRWTPLDRFELRFEAPNYVDGNGPSGFTDPALGAKIQLGPLDAWDLGLIAMASLPLGDDALSSGSVDPEVIVTAGRALSARTEFGAQLSAARDGGAGLWIWGGTLVLGGALGERLGTFVEVAVTVPERGPAELLPHMGFTYAVTPNLQFDLHTGSGLTDAAPTRLLGVGFTARR